jgi:hypothetical protein
MDRSFGGRHGKALSTIATRATANSAEDRKAKTLNQNLSPR